MPTASKERYRTWDRKDKKMRRISSVSVEEQYVSFKDEPNKKVPLKDNDLMKYMGLASERRQPIAEGDIVTFIQDNEIEVALVTLTKEGEWFFNVPRTGKNVVPWNTIDKPPLKDIEIVGNKFENPDYLSKEYSNTVKLWHMYDILSSDKICEDEYCRHDLRSAMKNLSTRTKRDLLTLIERLSSDLRHYKKAYMEEHIQNLKRDRIHSHASRSKRGI